jgi:hypothetical protein
MITQELYVMTTQVLYVMTTQVLYVMTTQVLYVMTTQVLLYLDKLFWNEKCFRQKLYRKSKHTFYVQ